MTESRGDRMVQALRPALHPIQQQRNPIQEALDNYQQLEARLREVEQHNVTLQVQNGAFLAEIHMLRDALERSENERVQKAAIAATFVAQAKSLNAIMSDMMRAAMANGIEAIERRHPEETAQLEHDVKQAREILERVEPAHGTPPIEPNRL